MISMLLVLILAWQFYLGYTRGLVLQSYYFITSLLSLAIATYQYQTLATKLSLWIPYANPTQETQMFFFTNHNLFELDIVFYHGVAFLVAYAISYGFFRLIGIVVQGLSVKSLQSSPYYLVAGGLSLLTSIFSISLAFNVLSTIPHPLIQTQLASSWLSKLIINFPLLSQLINSLWIS